jgi:hypothetical protein
MSFLRSPSLRAACLALLVLAALVRPVLIIACEMHAVAFAHAADPHEHAHGGAGAEVDPGNLDGDDGHGAHEGQLLGSLGGAAAEVPTFELPAIAFASIALPEPSSSARSGPEPPAPFRPPIA